MKIKKIVKKVLTFLKNNIKKISLGLFLILFSLLSILIVYTAINDVSDYDDNLISLEKSCIKGRFLLPKIYTIEAPFKFEYEFTGTNNILKNTLCIMPKELLEEEKEFIIHISFLG